MPLVRGYKLLWVGADGRRRMTKLSSLREVKSALSLADDYQWLRIESMRGELIATDRSIESKWSMAIRKAMYC